MLIIWHKKCRMVNIRLLIRMDNEAKNMDFEL